MGKDMSLEDIFSAAEADAKKIADAEPQPTPRNFDSLPEDKDEEQVDEEEGEACEDCGKDWYACECGDGDQ